MVERWLRTDDAACIVRSRARLRTEPDTSRADTWFAVEPTEETPPAAPNTHAPTKPTIAPPTPSTSACDCPDIVSCSEDLTISLMSRSCNSVAFTSSVNHRRVRIQFARGCDGYRLPSA